MQGGKNGTAHCGFGGALFRPDFPLSDALSQKHLDPGDGGDSLFCGKPQELCSLRAVNQVHDDAAVQLAGGEGRNPIVRVHADRGGVKDRVEEFRAQRAARHDFSAHGPRQFLRGLLAAGANSDNGSGASEREGSGAG